MERRIVKLIEGKAGGTASKGSKTYKLSLPNKWVQELKLQEHQISISYDGNKIVIEPILSNLDFYETKLSLGHELIILKYYDNNRICSVIVADYTDKSLSVDNKTTDIVKTAFGINISPTWNDYIFFLQSRTIPLERGDSREYFELIGVDNFDLLEVIKKTSGRIAEDHQWISITETL